MMEAYVSEGGNKGFAAFGGTDAFDASSNHGAYSAMLSDVDYLSKYDRK